MQTERIEADVLCVGGGIAGLMAAIRASETGAKVVVADKSNTLHSGAGGGGNDHIMCYIPEIHGTDIRPIIEAVQNSLIGGMRHTDFLLTWLQKTYDIVKLWDSWGIPMKYKGNWEFAGHALPGRPQLSMHYNGQNQKTVLTREALKRGAQIINRVMVFDLLCDESVIGALGISTREDKLYEFRAKSIVLATGRCVRLYPSPVPGWMFNLAYSPSTTGDGRAMAYRAGAELANIEIPERWAGPRNFSRCGKGTWIGVLKDPQGRPVGPFVTVPDRKHGDPASDIYPTVFDDYAKSAKGPVYMDCAGMSDEDWEYMLHFFRHEGLTALVRHMEEEGIDPRKKPVEFGTYELMPRGGVYHGENGETLIEGLYTAGDESYSSGGISIASTYGWITGENAAKRAKEVKLPDIEPKNAIIAEKEALLNEIKSRKVGADWKEANVALQQIMNDYAGSSRAETYLDAGSNHIKRLRKKVDSTLMASNQHELVHCLEVLDLFDVAEAVFIAAKERKETRGKFVRVDYPFTNPLLEQFLLVRQQDGKPVTEWRRLRR